MFQARQGDVFLSAVDAIPAEAQKQKGGTLAYGEVTGHSHVIDDLEQAEVLVTPEGEMYVRVHGERVALLHQEHGPIEVPKGDYRVVIQREETPDQVIRDVAD